MNNLKVKGQSGNHDCARREYGGYLFAITEIVLYGAE